MEEPDRHDDQGRQEDQTYLVAALERTLGTAVGVLLLAMMAITCVDVIGRYWFNLPVPGASELIELSMGVLIFGALPLVTARSEHIVLGLLDFLFKARARRVQGALTSLISAAVIAVMTWRLWLKADELTANADASVYLSIPLAPVAYFMSAAAGGTIVILLLLAVHHARGPSRPRSAG